MTVKRKIEVFSAGCPVCKDAVNLMNKLVCESCEVSVLDMNEPEIAERAKTLGIRSVPTIVIDGELADCCAGEGPDEATLRAAGISKPLS
jgi:glutaredoxin